MALRCKIHNHIRLLIFEKFEDELSVRNIPLDKFIIRFILHRFKRLQVPCIGEQIQIDNLILRIFIYHMMYKIPADETGASCYDDFHCMLLLLSLC